MEGHNTSGNLLLIIFLADNSDSADVSETGVEEPDGDGGVDGLLLSADKALLGADWDDGNEELTFLVKFGDGHRRELIFDGVGDLYLELTSLVRDRRVAVNPLFFSAGTSGLLVVSTADSLCNSWRASNTSIQTIQIRRHWSTFYQMYITHRLSYIPHSRSHQKKKTQQLKMKILFLRCQNLP